MGPATTDLPLKTCAGCGEELFVAALLAEWKDDRCPGCQRVRAERARVLADVVAFAKHKADTLLLKALFKEPRLSDLCKAEARGMRDLATYIEDGADGEFERWREATRGKDRTPTT